MLRSFFPLIIFACALPAQTKKILLRNGDAELVKEWAAVKTNARLVPVTGDTIMKEIADSVNQRNEYSARSHLDPASL